MFEQYTLEDVKDNLKNFRISQGLTIDQFIEKVGCSKRYIYWESGKNQIPISNLMQIANTFNVDISIFFKKSKVTEPYKFKQVPYGLDNFKEYDGRPIYVYPSSSMSSATGWGIVDYKNKQIAFGADNTVPLNLVHNRKLYALPNTINSALFFDEYLELDDVLKLSQVWVEFVENREMQSKFTGWYKVILGKKNEIGALQNGNLILNLSYYGKNYIAYKNCYPKLPE